MYAYHDILRVYSSATERDLSVDDGDILQPSFKGVNASPLLGARPAAAAARIKNVMCPLTTYVHTTRQEFEAGRDCPESCVKNPSTSPSPANKTEGTVKLAHPQYEDARNSF